MTLTEHFLGLVRRISAELSASESEYLLSRHKSTRKFLLVEERAYWPKRFVRVLMFQYYWKSAFFLTFCVFDLRVLAVSVGPLLQLVKTRTATATTYTEMSSKHKKIQKNAYLL